ncbi:MAG: PAS domain S-box protein [Syntrophothermus sp.]
MLSAWKLESDLAVKNAELRCKSTLDSMMEGCAIFDFNWICIYVNDANARHAHYNKEDMIGKNFLELFPGSTEGAFYQAYEKCMITRQPQSVTSEYCFPDGSSAWYEVKVQPVPEGIFVFSTDITVTKNTELALRNTLRRLQFHIENSPLAYVEFDNDSRIIQWSKNAEKIFGWTQEEVLGKHIWDFKWVYDEDVKAVEELNSDMSGSKRSSNLNTNRNYRKDGSVIVCEWYNSSLINPDGALDSISSLVLDITERMKAREDLEWKMQELLRAEEKMNEALCKLEKSNKELEHFAYISAHDLQEPLRMISTYTSMLERSFSDQIDGKALQYMVFIKEGACRMQHLIKDLLSYTRISNNAGYFKKVDTNQIVHKVLQNLKLQISDASAAICCGELPVITANPVQIEPLFLNLISNAIKFRGKAHPEIKIGCIQGETEWTFYVKDNGIGINPEFHQKIFIIFQRLYERAQYDGTGIGLSICQRIAEEHKGRIWVESAEGKGSTFFFTISKSLTPIS